MEGTGVWGGTVIVATPDKAPKHQHLYQCTMQLTPVTTDKITTILIHNAVPPSYTRRIYSVIKY